MGTWNPDMAEAFCDLLDAFGMEMVILQPSEYKPSLFDLFMDWLVGAK